MINEEKNDQRRENRAEGRLQAATMFSKAPINLALAG
jgi:hypothetical protein